MFVRDILKLKGGDVVKTSPQEPLVALARALTERHIGAVVVCDKSDRMVGIISERDVMRGVAEHDGKVTGLKVSALMTRDVITCAPDDTLPKIMSVMTAQRIRHLPVIDDGRLVGLISIGDVMKFRLEETLLDDEAMRDYIGGRLY